jgi:hypothetical protein
MAPPGANGTPCWCGAAGRRVLFGAPSRHGAPSARSNRWPGCFGWGDAAASRGPTPRRRHPKERGHRGGRCSVAARQPMQLVVRYPGEQATRQDQRHQHPAVEDRCRPPPRPGPPGARRRRRLGMGADHPGWSGSSSGRRRSWTTAATGRGWLAGVDLGGSWVTSRVIAMASRPSLAASSPELGHRPSGTGGPWRPPRPAPARHRSLPRAGSWGPAGPGNTTAPPTGLRRQRQKLWPPTGDPLTATGENPVILAWQPSGQLDLELHGGRTLPGWRSGSCSASSPWLPRGGIARSC